MIWAMGELGGRVILRMLALAGEGRHMRGPGWRGLWLGKPDGLSRDLINSISDVYKRVVDRLRADLDLPADRNHMLFVICDDTSRGVERMVRLFVSKKEWEPAAPCGPGLAWGRFAFVSEPPTSIEFRITLAHELCHAWCSAEFGRGRSSAWVFEGYAHNVAYWVCGSDPELVAGELTNTRDLLRSGRALGIRDLFAAAKLDAEHHGEATAFVHYLHSLRKEKPEVWEFVQDALAGRIADADAALDRLFAATRMPLRDVAAEFVAHCQKAAERSASRRDHARGVELRTHRSQN